MLVYISEAAGNYTCLHVYLIGPSIDAPVTVASTTLAPERISFNTFWNQYTEKRLHTIEGQRSVRIAPPSLPHA